MDIFLCTPTLTQQDPAFSPCTHHPDVLCSSPYSLLSLCSACNLKKESRFSFITRFYKTWDQQELLVSKKMRRSLQKEPPPLSSQYITAGKSQSKMDSAYTPVWAGKVVLLPWCKHWNTSGNSWDLQTELKSGEGGKLQRGCPIFLEPSSWKVSAEYFHFAICNPGRIR